MAWKRLKNESEPEPAATPRETVPSASTGRREVPMEKIVNIGQSVEITGELKGNEDLTVEGKVDGKITLKDHNLTIGANGRIKGEIFAKSVVVLGEVDGNIQADDKVEIAATGSMTGDLLAPRVVLADGCRFKGSIDMERSKPAASAATSAKPVATPPEMPKSMTAKA